MTVHRLVLAVLVVVLAAGCSASPREPARSGAADPGAGAGTGAAPPVDRPVQVGSLWFDATEVTVGRLRQFAAETSLRTAAEREGGGFEFDGGWQRRPGWSYLRPYGSDAAANAPAVHVSWAEARSYCQWAGGRLPTAEQWRAAAYTEGRATPPAPLQRGQTYEYPTGSDPQPANVQGDGDGYATAAPVGSFPAGVNGLYDMGANVWEWLEDGRDGERLVAGGSWWYGPSQMTAGAFQYKQASFYAVYVGLRCVYDSLPLRRS